MQSSSSPTAKRMVTALHIHSIHTALARIQMAFALLAMATAALEDSKKETSIHHISSPHTHQTLAFFEVSGVDLATCTLDDTVYLTKSQNHWEGVEIHLNKYTLDNIPEQLAQGMVFSKLTLGKQNIFEQEDPVPLDTDVVTKVLRALGTVHAVRFTIDSDVAEAMEAQALPSPKPFLLSLYTKHLWLDRPSEASAAWFFACIDLSQSVCSVQINYAHRLTNLRFLDHLNSPQLSGLAIHAADNLTNLDCQLLKEKRVRDELILRLGKTLPTASPDTLQAIASKRWACLRAPLGLWSSIAKEFQPPFAVNCLVLDAEFLGSLNALWGVYPKEKISVKSFRIEMSNGDKKPKPEPENPKIHKELFSWVNRCFTDIERLTVLNASANTNASEPPNPPYVCIDPFLPKLRDMYCQIGPGFGSQLYSNKSTRWITPVMYSTWATGQLNGMMKEVYQKNVFSINKNFPSLFLPPQNPDPNPRCFACKTPLKEINNLGTRARTRYIGIVCDGGHMGCSACLEILLKDKQDAKEVLHCLHCNSEIANADFHGVIKRKTNGLGYFKIHRVDLSQ
ncbi:hypothetical protein NEDG_01466 [Nematocida displodere]|uniref:Uncharacterized protein n=1 Tax=Nematocida displodere TaxID=1805483 RepID=A0A177EFZ6_9MICR|nr:hypothetical protein NEDG_01466 [Nematocida displodere]